MPGELSERQAFLVLNALPGVGPITLNRLLAAFGGDPRAILAADRRKLQEVEGVRPLVTDSVTGWRDHLDPVREEDRLARSGADFILPRDEAYPGLLREIHDPPIGLYRKGPYAFGGRCIAIVGSRKATLYGQAVAKKLGAELAQLGFCVVSGLARGVDTAAHEGALSVGGKTAAVLGTGLDIIYPPENLALYRRITETGAVLSEFPFGRQADRQSFPMRNRVVAGMSEAVVVVESDVHGGAMITARFAGENGRLLFAVPGRIDQPTSAGCNQLIRDGATLLTGVNDLLQELHYLGDRRPGPIAAKPGAAPGEPAGLAQDESQVFECFRGGTTPTPDALAVQTGLPAAQVGVALTMLEMKGLVARRPDGSFEACP